MEEWGMMGMLDMLGEDVGHAGEKFEAWRRSDEVLALFVNLSWRKVLQ